MNSCVPFIVTLGVVLVLSACMPPRNEDAPTGEFAYLRYCASCHGAGGRGDGPVARELKTVPTDLTKLAERAGGAFDEAAVLASVDGRREVAAHGPRAMPVWGVVFESELRAENKRYPKYVTLLSARALVDYIRGLQATAPKP